MKFGETFLDHQIPEWCHQYTNYELLTKLLKQINYSCENSDIWHKSENTINENLEQRSLFSNVYEERLSHSEVKSMLSFFFITLNRDIGKVDKFYNSQFQEYDRRLTHLLLNTRFTDIFSMIRMNDHPKTSFLMLTNQQEYFPRVNDSSSIKLTEPFIDHFNEDFNEIICILIDLRFHFRNLKWYVEWNKRAFTKILEQLDKKIDINHHATYIQFNTLPLSFPNESKIVRRLNLISHILHEISQYINNMQKIPDNSLVDNRNKISFTSDVLELIRIDDSIGLISKLTKKYQSTSLIPTRTLISILNRAALYEAFQCMDKILDILTYLKDPSDINGRNLFHNYIISLGKSLHRLNHSGGAVSNKADEKSSLCSHLLELTIETLQNTTSTQFETFDFANININDSPDSLIFILDKLPLHLRSTLLEYDNHKFTPLHYSAQYGLTSISKVIIEFLIKWDLWDQSILVNNIKASESGENLSPLELAVIGVHPSTLEVLLSFISSRRLLNIQRLLNLSIRLNSVKLVDILFSINYLQVDYCDEETHETSLFLACKLNLFDIAQFLISKGANTEIREQIFGWSPIFIAACKGFEKIVKLLVDNGANCNIFDIDGWTPREHAVFRGHLKIADMIRVNNSFTSTTLKMAPECNGYNINNNHPQFEGIDAYTQSVLSTQVLENTCRSSHSIPSLSADSKLDTSNMNSIGVPKMLPETTKSFGYEYLRPDESMILVTLGSNNTRLPSYAISFNPIQPSKISSTELDMSLSLVISCSDDILKQPIELNLPLDDHMNCISFKVPFKSDSNYTIIFDIVSTDDYVMDTDEDSLNNVLSPVFWNYDLDKNRQQNCLSKSKTLGRGVALLNKVHTSVGDNRRPLSNTITIPILSKESLEIFATIKFEFLIVTPFYHPKALTGRTDTYWKSLVSTRLIGHRGLGKNTNNRTFLQLGENTIESFIAAASLGASYVEFDVQLTKDHVPIVYHDFLVAESGVDIPMHDLTLEQFLDFNNIHKHYKGTDKRYSVDDTDAVIRKIIKNEDNDINNIYSRHHDRMKLTKTFKKNAFKGNSRGHSIASNFITLNELFRKIPQNVGFNIECKYPMLDEAEQEDISRVAIELNHWVDSVLNVVYENAKGRDIIFSSFHPDICIMLSLKQPNIPILFLTEGGTTEMADIRAISIQNAIQFSRKWNLLGIVSAAKPIVKAPRLASVVKSTGLVCITYGVENNNPDIVQLQMNSGVDAIIVDNVSVIKKTLNNYNQQITS